MRHHPNTLTREQELRLQEEFTSTKGVTHMANPTAATTAALTSGEGIVLNFRMKKETPGAFQFVELDRHGNPYTSPNSPGCVVHSLYLRKTSGIRGPRITLRITEGDDNS